MRKVFKRFPFYKVFVSLFVIFYTFFPSVQAIGIVVEDYASDDISEVEVDSSEDILDEGISDPEWIANPELLEEDDEEEEDEPLFVYEDGVYTVFNVIEDEEYVYPNNENVRIEFTSITEEGDLNISRVTLTEQQREELNTTDEYGWSITSSMSNGSFEYNLTLPNTLGNDVEVKYSSEDSGEFNSIEDVVVNEDVIYMERLDHFTVFVVVGLLPTGVSEGDACTVSISGSDISGNQCYTTIQAAIDAADTGDTIKVGPGTYNENVNINLPINLLNASSPIIDCTGLGGNGILINAPNVTIDGFEITNCDIGIRSYGGPSDYENLTIRNTEIHNNSQNGITLLYDNFDTVTLENLEIHNNSQNGIGISDGIDVNELIFTDLNILNNGHHGIYIASTGTNISEINANNVNILDNNYSAITIDSGSLVSNASFSNSKFEGSDTNFAVRGTTTYVDGLIITDSSISYSPTNHGFWLRDGIVENLEFDNVSIIDNRHQGFHVTNNATLRDSVIKNGVIKDNAWGLLTIASTITNLTIDNVDFLDNFAGSGLSVASGTVNGLNILNSTFENNAWEHLDIGIGWIGALTASNITVLLNTFKTGTGTSIWIADNATFGEQDININENNFVSSIFAINNNTLTAIDATHNWWGDNTGPSGTEPGLGGAISSNVDHIEWLCEPYETGWTSINGSCDIQDIGFGFGSGINGVSSDPGMCNVFTNDTSLPGNKALQILQFNEMVGAHYYMIQGYQWNGSRWVTSGNAYNPAEYASNNANVEFSIVNGIATYQTGATNEGIYTYQVTAYSLNGTPIGYSNPIDINDYDNACKFIVDRTAPSIPELLFPNDNQALRSSELYIEWGESTDNHTSSENITYEYRIYYRDPILFPDSYWVFSYTGTTRHPSSGFASGTAEGIYWYTVQAIDEVGNESGFAPFRTFQVDNTPPTISITHKGGNILDGKIITNSINALSYDGIYTDPSDGSGLNRTSFVIWTVDPITLQPVIYPGNNTPHLCNWNGSAANIITLNGTTEDSLHDIPLANCTSHAPANWDYPDGTYRIGHIVYDNAGNLTSFGSSYFIIETEAPTGSIDYIYYSSRDVTVPTFITNDNTPVLGGTCSDNMGLDTVVLEINGQTYPVVCDDEDKWRFDSLYELPDGEHTATLTLTDLAGNETIETQNVTIDTVAPTAVHTYYRNGEEITDSIAYVQGIEDITFTGVYEDEDPSSGLYKDVFVIFRNDLQFYCAWNQVLTGGVSLNGSDFYELNDHQSLTDCVDFLEDGSYHIRHRIYDHATRSSDPLFYQHREYINLNFVVDTEAPTSEFIPDISDSYHNSLPIVLSGTTVDENNVDYVELHITPVGDSDNTIVVTLPNESNSSVFNWTYSDWEPEEGVYDIYAHGVDLAGNVENTSIVTNVTFDTTPPEITNLSVSIDYLGLYVNGINGFTIYADVYDTLSGIDPNSCEYTLDGSNWHSGTYNSTDGRCQFDVSSSDLFNNQALGIQVSVMDLAGNSSESGVLNRTVDANYPTSDVTLEYEYYGPNRLPIITGTASDTVSGVQYVNITIQRNSDDKYWDQNLGWVSDTTMLPTVGTETWIYPELLGGLENTVSYSVTPYATDNVDNTAQGISTSFVWDNEPPTVPQNLHISDPNIQCNWYTNSNVVQFQWNPSTDTLSGVKNYEFYYNNPELVEPEIWDMGGNHTTTSINLHLNFGEGEYSLRVRAIDNIGNIGGWSDECTVTFDETAPTVEIDPSRSPDWEGWYSTRPDYNNVPPTFSIISDDTEAYLEYQWNDKNDNGWQAYTTEGIEYPEDGIHTLYIKGTDFAGNVGEDQLEAWFDFTSPVGTFLQIPDSNGYVRGTIELNFEGVYDPSGSEEIARVQIWVGNQLIGSADHIGGQEYTFDLDTTLLGDGQHNVTGSIFDRAGNRTMISQSIVVDNTAPEITFELPINEEIVSGEVDLQATCNEDCTYINFWWRKDGESYSNTTPERNYHYVWEQGTLFEWTLDTLNAERWGGDPSYIMEDGVYYLYAAGKDLAGNWASTPEVMIIVDNTPPETTLKEDPSGTYTNEPINIAGTSTDILSNVVNLTLEYRETGQGDEAWLEIPASELNSEENPLENPAPSTSWNWAVTWTPSDDGTYDIRAYATDQVGNVEGSAYIEGVTYDTTSPEVFLELIAGILSVSVEDILSGKDTIEVRIGEDGEWLEYEEGMNLNELVDGQPGTYTVYVRVADKAGNTTIASGTFTIPSPPPTTPEEVLGAIIAPFTPQPALALGTGGPVYTYTTSVTEDTDVEDDELEEEDIDDQDDIEDEDTDVRGVEDENDIDEEDDGGIRWWIYPLVILPLILIFFILWKRRKDDEENNQY